MFGGLIEQCGIISRSETRLNAQRIWIQAQFKSLILGESIAVDGICLTVTAVRKNEFCCDVSSESLAVTTASDFKIGQTVNLERALRIGDRLGGHFVLGHVDTTVAVLSTKQLDGFTEIELGQFSAEQQRYLLPKGSITVNGVSLTLNKVNSGKIKLMLIPHTLALTNLDRLIKGSLVNIEFDYLAKILQQHYGYFPVENRVKNEEVF